MKVENKSIDDLIPYHNNPRKNQAIDKVASSIKEYGFQQPIVVDKDMVVIVGHTRLLGAKKLGLTEVPIVVADLGEAKAKAYRLADNRVNEDSMWDNNLLQNELNQLLDFEIDLNLTGFTNEELDSIFSKEEIEITDPISELDDENRSLNDVKMIQLFYDPESEQIFRQIIDRVKNKYSLDNISDAVLKCVKNEGEKL
tara:strand:- start:15 stop:608 length:594 start_codon:yes stop_codon:yes gene_type:complete